MCSHGMHVLSMHPGREDQELGRRANALWDSPLYFLTGYPLPGNLGGGSIPEHSVLRTG